MGNREFVIDTQVLYEAENTTSPFFLHALAFLASLAQHTGHYIAVDYEHRILDEYQRMFTQSTLKSAQKMFLHLQHHNRIQFYPGEVYQAVQDELLAIGFDDADLPFVGTAARSTDKLLIAEESDYSSPVKALLDQGLGIKVLAMREASSRL